MSKKTSLLVTCEHGGNLIPPKYRHLFRGHEELLHTHRGYDPGALTVAKELAKSLAAALFVSTTSRMLIDLNRSIGHPRLYSEATRNASADVRREILEEYYLPYRELVESHIARMTAMGHRIIHISSHSFTPVLDGEVRNADIGLLYDPARPGELELCQHWQSKLKAEDGKLRIRRNYPYKGTSDGFTAYLRKSFESKDYVGIELEVNQKRVLSGSTAWQKLRQRLISSLQTTIQTNASQL